MTRPIVLPLVHLNGTSETELKAVRETAYDALNTAYHALKATAPNVRDYYCHPTPNAFNLATDRHTSRLARLGQLMQELEEEMVGIDEGTHTVTNKTPAQEAPAHDPPTSPAIRPARPAPRPSL